MIRLLVGIFMLAGGVSVCWADDLTDAITNVDPRNRLTSGTGAALHEAYGPKEPEEAAPVEDLSENPTLPSYGLSAKDLLDPLGIDKEKDNEKEKDGVLPESGSLLNDQGPSSGEDTVSYPSY